MCNTPTYCDLGKAAKDVFNKGYGKYAIVNFQFGVSVSMECLHHASKNKVSQH